jgi:hypothetical protein
MEPLVVARLVEDRLLARHAELYGPDPSTRAISLAHALASSPAWATLRDSAVLAVRTGPRPLLGVIGRVPLERTYLLEALGSLLDQRLERLLPMGYAEVEANCARLGDRLRAHLGDRGVATCSLIGLPRGGLVVAALLSYHLGISGERVGTVASASNSGPRVLVDDLILSGARLRSWLRSYEGPPLVLAHLASVPACREAILATEPLVAASVAATDLQDYAATDHDDGWRARWRERSPEDYWTGEPDNVVFPWNEPDLAIWNPQLERAEDGWRVVPPAWCVKNRARAGSIVDEVQEVRSADIGQIRPAPEVIWARFERATVLAGIHDDQAFRLVGPAERWWNEILLHGDDEAAVSTVAAYYGAPRAMVRDDLRRLAEQLRERQLIVDA